MRRATQQRQSSTFAAVNDYTAVIQQFPTNPVAQEALLPESERADATYYPFEL